MSGKPTTSNDGRNNQLTVERDVPNSEVDEKLDAYFGDDTEDRKMHFVAGSVLNNSEKIKVAISKANLEVEDEEKASSVQIKNIIKYI